MQAALRFIVQIRSNQPRMMLGKGTLLMQCCSQLTLHQAERAPEYTPHDEKVVDDGLPRKIL
jgi:hypothetical protein